MSDFGALKGETITAISGMEPGSDRVEIKTASGKSFEMYHRQECCEGVSLAEVHGSPADLIGEPVLLAEESTNQDNPPEHADSFTWTFYRLQTIKGAVQLRWLGKSNGYYGEEVEFEDTTPEVAHA